MTKIAVPMFEAYVTNVCNLNCSECNRLNNYKFSGHYKWSDVEQDYARWSRSIEPGFINILGGEPFLNRDLPNWIRGLRNLWPIPRINIATNGTMLHLYNNLYDILLENRTGLNISAHNRKRYQPLVEQIKQLLKDPIVETYHANFDRWIDSYNAVKDPSWPDCQSYLDFDNLPENIKKECKFVHNNDPETWKIMADSVTFVDKNNVTIKLGYSENFVSSPLKYSGNHSFQVYNSDPDQSHKVCISKHCTEIVDGKMYKCHHVALLPKFMQQYHVEISSDDRDLLLSYQPLESTATREEIIEFVNKLASPIPQCKLCPENLEMININPTTKKLAVNKLWTITPVK